MEVTPAQLIALLREGRAPRKVRAAVARGGLALPAATLLEALELLGEDPDAAVAAEAAASLERIPPSVLRAVASSPTTSPALLERIIRRFGELESVAVEVAGNPGTPDGAFVFAAGLPLPAVLEVLGRDRERLDRCPEAVAALLANTETPTEVVALWQEPARRGGAAAAAGGGAAAVPRAGDAEGEAEQAFDSLLVDDAEEGPAAGGDDGGGEALSARQLSIYAMLKRLSMGQKVALAVKGNREVRNILVRDTNKLLCLKVLENPRVGDADVEAWAKSTNISEDVLRAIANRKDWVKRPAVVRALVFNPRTPLGVSLDFLKHLGLRDLEHLTKNRNVPETLRNAGRKLHQLKRERRQ